MMEHDSVSSRNYQENWLDALSLLTKAEERIRELEAQLAEAQTSVKSWSDKAMEFSDLASKYEDELAELKKGEPVDGVVIREGQPTLLMCKHINPTDERLYLSPVIPEGMISKAKELLKIATPADQLPEPWEQDRRYSDNEIARLNADKELRLLFESMISAVERGK